ncbi:MAG: hypothetical protein OXB88_11080 [Bacteriovoracales bacterium]|nr:hypothetical protein [Bacteriovoracales bacterium]
MRPFFFLVSLFSLIFFSTLSPKTYGKEWLDVRLALLANSQRVFRGTVFYPHPSLFAGPFITLFDRFSIRGPHLSWIRATEDGKHEFSLGGYPVIDGAPLIRLENDFDEEKDFRASRSDAFELSFHYTYNFGPRRRFNMEWFAAKEVHRHRGIYAGFSFKAPLYRHLSLSLSTAMGSKAHNRYIYGDRGRSGLAHQDLSLRYLIPNAPWGSLISLGAVHSRVLQEDNKTAELVRGNHAHWATSFMWLKSF